MVLLISMVLRVDIRFEHRFEIELGASYRFQCYLETMISEDLRPAQISTISFGLVERILRESGNGDVPKLYQQMRPIWKTLSHTPLGTSTTQAIPKLREHGGMH